MRRALRPLDSSGLIVEHDGRQLVNLASNDYLALSQHPRLKAAATQAIEQFGVGAGASRLVTGTLSLHEQVERQFAAFKHSHLATTAGAKSHYAALILPTGYMANLAVLTSLAGPGDLICLDKLSHASLIDAAHATGAQVRVYPHLQTAKLRRLLERHETEVDSTRPQDAQRPPRRFIVTDSVFSMDGDVADLPELCDIADEHDAILVVDEAHATGLLGECGSGLCEAQGVTDRIHITISTASKGLGGLGGIITAHRSIIDTLINRARSLIYTTAVPPGQVAAIGAALDVVRDEPWRRERVAELSTRVRAELTNGWQLPAVPLPTPIIPLIVGEAAEALALAEQLKDAGFLAPAIRPPTVPPGSARVRISLRADLEDEQVARLMKVLQRQS